jgi:transcriptional regulator with XRE-family HTH domain
MRVINRLQEYLTRKNISPYIFEKKCGIANGYLSKQMKGKGSIGSEIINKIKEQYKDLNITWLLTGEGQMLTSRFYVQSDQVSALAENEAVYETQQHTIKTLREKILILENALADKEKIIKLLEKQVNSSSS